MINENTKQGASVGEMHKRREVMEDGRRYIIYYTFKTPEPNSTGEVSELKPTTEVRDDV
jgi:hypothetical protein